MTDVALVLQGGGALGAFEAGVIEVVLEKGWNPVVVSGVSIGAVNAATLCAPRGGDAAAELHVLWEDLTAPCSMASFVVPDMGLPWLAPWDYWRHMSILDPTNYHETIERHVRFEDLKPSGPAARCIVTAVDIGAGELRSFDSGQRDLRREHIVASSSLPVAFPPCAVSTPEGSYIDGGIYDNTPLKYVIGALESGPIKKVDVLIVVNLFPKAGVLPTNPIEYADRIFEIILSNKSDFDAKLAGRIKDLAALVPELEKLIPEERRDDYDRLRGEHPQAFELFDKQVVFDRLVQITHTGHEPLNGILDFSKEKRQKRWSEGREAAKAQL